MQEENVKELTIQQIKDVRKKIFILEKVYFIIALLMALGTGLWICTFDSYVIKWLLGTISLLIVGCRLVKKQKSFIISQIFCIIAVILYFYLLRKLSGGDISNFVESIMHPMGCLFLILPLSVLILFSLTFIGGKLYLRYPELTQAQNNFILETLEKCDRKLLLKFYKTNIKLYLSSGIIIALFVIVIVILTTNIEADNLIIISILIFPIAIILAVVYLIKKLILAQKIKSPFPIPFTILRQFIINNDIKRDAEN